MCCHTVKVALHGLPWDTACKGSSTALPACVKDVESVARDQKTHRALLSQVDCPPATIKHEQTDNSVCPDDAAHQLQQG